MRGRARCAVGHRNDAIAMTMVAQAPKRALMVLDLARRSWLHLLTPDQMVGGMPLRAVEAVCSFVQRQRRSDSDGE